MADLSDVENALVDAITTVLYPNGNGGPSIAGMLCRVYRGWPSPAALNADLSGGVVNVTVAPAPVAGELPVPYFDVEYTVSPASTLFAALSGQSVTMSGTPARGQMVGILADNIPYVYEVGEKDTPESIAASLGVTIRAQRDVSISYATLTIPGTRSLSARVVTNGFTTRALRRQRKEIRISCWCPEALTRDLIAKSIDIGLTGSTFLALADTTKVRVQYLSTETFDQSRGALLYRRDLSYHCEYTAIIRRIAPVMLFGDLFDGNEEIHV